MPAVLAVDLGKTSCRAALWTDEASTAQPRRANDVGAPGLAFRDGVELAERAIAGAWRQLLADSEPPDAIAVCVGAAGALAAPEAARTLAGRLSALIPTGTVAICSDAVIAHAGALDGRPGLVLVAGTGSVVIGVGSGSDAELVRVDGWGPFLGDLGSGGWIGTAGLRAALRAYDGRGPETDLEQAALTQFGELADLPTRFADRTNAIRLAAAFAPVVASLAAAHDQVSRQIMDEAAGHLAETVIAARRRLLNPQNQDPENRDPDHPSSENRVPDISDLDRQGSGAAVELAVVGGLTELGPPMLEPLAATLAIAAPDLTIDVSTGGPLDGARRLALDTGTVHETRVYRTTTQRTERADPQQPTDRDRPAATARHRSE